MSDDQRFKDLATLAMARVLAAFDSVGQLMEHDAEVYALYVAVATGIVETAADHIHDALERKQHTKLPPDGIKAAQVHVVGQILDNLGLEHAAADKDDLQAMKK